MHVGIFFASSEAAGGQNLSDSHTGGNTGRNEESGKNSRVDQRETDQRRDQEAGVGADGNRQHHDDGIDPDAEFFQPVADRFNPA